MTENRVVSLRPEGAIDDPLTEILRAGARSLIAQAVEAEFAAFLGSHEDKALPDGRQRVVRHGHDPARVIQTGIGPVEVKKPKARDRGAAAGGERIRFSSSILPQWARRTKSLDALLPALYLRGVSAGDFQEALAALLGKDAANLSPSVISRLKGEWEGEYERWRKRDLSARRYVYLWADGVYLQARMEPQAECMLVLIGATPEGRKELVGFQAGYRESAQSWKELLVDLKARGLAAAPELAVGDGALGFWKALDEAFPTTRHQRCWVHKTVNVLEKLPKSLQPSAHADLREIWLSPSRAAAEAAMATFAGEVRPEIRRRRQMPAQGSRHAADGLRLPRRALGAPAHVEPDRERLRHRPSPHGTNQGRAVAGHRQDHGVQADHVGVENLAAAERSKSVAETHRRRKVQGRNRSRR